MNPDQKITITLDINELNTVMGGLGKLPYEQAFMTIDVIRQQVAPQIQQQQGGEGGGAMGPGREG
jgi:bacteriocin-like protein